mgnify:CR=1 FL=1|tara:strand:- start:15 stop:704 length:690 start_codon:yes stop_codon:yes gene_type:complete
MTICIIPARSGSKRIKNKNIIKINGIPIIAKTIRIAKQSMLFKRIIVSTDSQKIAKIAKKYGAEVPFLRSKDLSNDYTPTIKVMLDAMDKIKSFKDKFHFCIYPTSILINQKDLKSALLKIKRTKSDFICPIEKFESNPLRSFSIKNSFINFNWPKNQMKRSQDLKELYYDTGSFYIYRTESLLKMNGKQIMPKKSTYIFLKKKFIDVNYPEDLVLLKKYVNQSKKIKK